MSERQASEPLSSTQHDIHNRGTSLVEYFGYGANTCGYCKGNDQEGRKSYDMKAYTLECDDYQKLLDRGWRRSGNYCYNPVNSRTCCPNYPISCQALKFNLTRSQRRCIAKVNSFLIHGEHEQNRHNSSSMIDYNLSVFDEADDNNSSSPPHNHEQGSPKGRETQTFESYKSSNKLRDKRFVHSCERKVRLYNISLEEAIRRTQERRRSRNAIVQKRLEDYLYPKTSSLKGVDIKEFKPKHELVIKLLHVDSKPFKDLIDDEHEIIVKYQEAVHKETADEWTLSRFSDFLIKTPLSVEPMEQHKNSQPTSSDTPSDTYLKDFFPNKEEFLLVKPPELPTCYGTYHCTYFLDGKLIAVGVLDVLTKCITTVYFFYDPKYKHLNLGVYSALIEISLVRQLARYYTSPSNLPNRLVHYYMGFYVHECPKMHYKTKFEPSFLLCSETYQYIPTPDCLRKLVANKYARFSPEDANSDFDLDYSMIGIHLCRIPIKAPCITSDKMMDYIQWVTRNVGRDSVEIIVNNIFSQYLRLVGGYLACRMTLKVYSVHNAILQRARWLSERNNEENDEIDDEETDSEDDS